jgi:hypothetical protein
MKSIAQMSFSLLAISRFDRSTAARLRCGIFGRRFKPCNAYSRSHALTIDRESPTTQKNMDALMTVTNTSCRDVRNPRRKHGVELARVRLVVEHRVIYLREATRASCANLESCDEKARTIALSRRLYSFL